MADGFASKRCEHKRYNQLALTGDPAFIVLGKSNPVCQTHPY